MSRDIFQPAASLEVQSRFHPTGADALGDGGCVTISAPPGAAF